MFSCSGSRRPTLVTAARTWVLRGDEFREARRLESSVEPGGVAAGHLLGTVLPLDEALGLDAEVVKVLLVRVRVRARARARVGVRGS